MTWTAFAMPANWISRGTVLIQLGRHHFAFFRGYLDGLDLRHLSERYIETNTAHSGATDLRVAKSLLTWIIDQLTITARRSGKSAGVRLIRMTPEKLAGSDDSAVPDLEAFREERDPHQMFSERELLELFEQEYGHVAGGADRRSRRNKRLRDRQLAVLNQLEALVQADPRLEDGVDGWLDPAIANRLVGAGITTLADLVEVIEAHGYRWYTKVPRIGIKAAAYISEWLMLPETARALGVTLSIRSVQARQDIDPAVLPALPRRTGIVPLEQFQMPHAMSGTIGTNRGERSSLSARNDLEAINVWLARKQAGSHTFRAYRKEAERFLLWSVLEAKKALSSLTVEDCIAYRDFLWRIGRETVEQWQQQFRIPQSDWMGPRGIDRFSSRWRPFEGALSESSQKTALVILQGMMQWLCDMNYLHNNPFKAMPHLARRREGMEVSRALTLEEWDAVKTHLNASPKDQKYFRLRFILALLYSTGCRLSELAGLCRQNLQPFKRAGELETQWELVVIGKGKRVRRVQLNRMVIAEVENYFQRRGYRSFLDAPATTPLIVGLTLGDKIVTTESALSAPRIYKVLKSFFEELAKATKIADPALAERYERVSTHWLRHTFATHGIQAGIAVETIRDLLGHRSLSTTSIYVTTEKDKRSREVEKLERFSSFDIAGG
jgi:site-specific recombinase XerD